MLSGPVVWLLDQQTKYMFLTYLCSPAGIVLLHVVSALSLALIIGGALLSRRNWKRAAGEGAEGLTMTRSRFMGLLGVLVNGLFALLIIAQWLPGFFFSPCQR